MTGEALRDEINKRLTLNWLIQGASQHAGMTLHYLVRDELAALDPRLIRLYDQFALVNLLQWWHLDAAILAGWPRRFWKRAATHKSHPFFGHPLLARHGGALAEAGRRRALDRCKEKGITFYPGLFSVQVAVLVGRLRAAEAPHRCELIELAKIAAAAAWGIPAERFDADLTTDVAFGTLRAPKTLRGHILRAAVTGYGGVVRRDDSLVVVGKGRNWLLVAKELVKGTAELVCLHGLNRLDDEAYHRVTAAADRIEFEPWMLQTGGELWRRLLALAPDAIPMSELLMHIALLPPRHLESLMLAVMERPSAAAELLQALGGDEPSA